MKSVSFLVLSILPAGCRTAAPQLLPLPKSVPEPKAIAAAITTLPAVMPAANAALEQRLKQQRQMIEALMSQNDALTAKLSAPAAAPTQDVASPKPPTAIETPRVLAVETAPSSVAVPVPPTSATSFVAPNADGVIDLTVASTVATELANPFAVRHLPADAAREVTVRINGVVGGSVPAALVNGRVIQTGETVESLTLERCEADAAIFRRGEQWLRLPINAQPVRIRFVL